MFQINILSFYQMCFESKRIKIFFLNLILFLGEKPFEIDKKAMLSVNLSEAD
jgi:hypothetical protein